MDRRVYDPEHSVMAHEAHQECACEEAKAPVVDHLMLFTTKTCPNCKMVKMMLQKENITDVEIIDAEENVDLTISLGITRAPTLLVPNEEGYDAYTNASEIKGWIEANK